jgi:transposase
MLFEVGVPLKNPALLQARVAALTATLEERTSAVARLQGERDALRGERDTFRTESDKANAEVEKLQLIIKDLIRKRYGARSEKLDPDQLQLALEEVTQSLGLA